MLIELSVKDFGIIEDINWKLAEGLNVITGETGWQVAGNRSA